MQSNKKPIRILFLGGAHTQVPIIEEAKNRGYYVITCDYFPNNPGHKLADEYHNVSTTDIDSILNLAKKTKPDLVVAYATDPAAPVAAYVSNKLGLPGNPYESIRILAEKSLFRTFQRERGFNVPLFVTLSKKDSQFEKLEVLRFPYIIKPNDSSGSKGISKVSCFNEIAPAVRYAFDFSRNKQIIAEEFIDNNLADVHGDGFVVDGELVFSFLGDHIYNEGSNPFNPIGTLWPSKQPVRIINKIENDVADIIRNSGFKNGGVNIEARINSEGKHFIMEIGPRNGGHFVPQAIQYATGFDMVRASLDILLGNKVIIPDQSRKYSAYYAIHSDYDGVLKNLSIKEELKPFIRKFHLYSNLNEKVKSFKGANAAIGILLMTFNNREEMEYIVSNMKIFIDLNVVII